MLVAISGSSGFIGKELCSHFINTGHEIVPVKRRDYELPIHEFKEILRDCDIFISLAGEPVMRRWTRANKRRLIASRIDPVSKVLTAMRLVKNRPRLFISASAIGVYDNTGQHSEDSTSFSTGFLRQLVESWENEVSKAKELVDVRVVIFRFGIVLGRYGGAFPKLAFPFRIGFGARFGNGRQYFSYVHIDDLVRAMQFVIDHKELQGVFNLTAPEPVTNRIFTKTLAKIMHRPGFLIVPKFLFWLRYGKASSMLFSGQNVLPSRLLGAGFEFKYSNIETTLHSLIDKD